MKYLFKNAKIFSGGEIIDGCVVVDGENIAYVGKNPPKGQFDEEIDVCGNVLMSGFVNAHCHTPSTVLRGVSDDLTLEDWLDDIIVKEQSLSDEEVYFSTMLGIAEYVRAGITTIEENYGRITAVVRALKKSGIRARFGIGFADVGKDQGISLDKQLKIVTAAGLKPVCYAHSVYGTTEENFEKLITFAKKNKLPVSTHLSETLTEVGTCSVKNNGLSPPELLETFGFLDRSATVYHAVHCDKDDLELLAAYNVNVVTCSSSNLKLGSGIAPVYAMQCKGINVAIGTDGAYSNNSYDMFKEMFLVATLNKATLNQANILPAKQVLKMATENGAKALGFDLVGQIKINFKADIILVDITSPHHQPVNNVISNLVYASKSSDVYLTMCGGKILYYNGKYNIGEDINKIYEENRKIREKLSKRG